MSRLWNTSQSTEQSTWIRETVRSKAFYVLVGSRVAPWWSSNTWLLFLTTRGQQLHISHAQTKKGASQRPNMGFLYVFSPLLPSAEVFIIVLLIGRIQKQRKLDTPALGAVCQQSTGVAGLNILQNGYKLLLVQTQVTENPESPKRYLCRLSDGNATLHPSRSPPKTGAVKQHKTFGQ